MQLPTGYHVFFTRNSEYHLQREVCIGVRDRRTGRWFVEHPALLRPLHGAAGSSGVTAERAPNLGESLEFWTDGGPVRTSPVLNVEERDDHSGRVGRMSRRPLAKCAEDDPRITR
jgi:hypothetical protein